MQPLSQNIFVCFEEGILIRDQIVDIINLIPGVICSSGRHIPAADMLDHLTSSFGDAIIAEMEDKNLDFVILFDWGLKVKICAIAFCSKPNQISLAAERFTDDA